MGYNKKKNLEQNIQSIEIAFELSRQNRQPTQEQRSILEKYSGFGGLSCILKPCDKPEDIDGWLATEKDLFEDTVRLYELIRKYSDSDDMYKSYVSSLKESKLTAFFTPAHVIKVLTESFHKNDILFHDILDPSAGTGAFFNGFEKNKENIVCFEKDYITAKILRLLHPEAEINSSGFETIEKYNNNYFDLVTSNIPFGNFKVYDQAFAESKDSIQKKSCNKIHNYFFIKAIDIVREGGIIAFITSRGLMNTPENRIIRERLMETCNLVSVIRLPNDLFIDIANTKAGSDLIILQKNTAKNIKSPDEEAFIETRILPNGCPVNNYLMDFSRVIYTKFEVTTDQYGQPGINFYYEKSKEDLAFELSAMLHVDYQKRLNKELYNKYLHENKKVSEENEEDDEMASDTAISLYDLFGITPEERTQLEMKQKTNLSKSEENPGILISSLEDPFDILRTSKKICQYKGNFEEYYTEGTIVQFKGQTGFLSIKKERKKDEVAECHMFNPIDVSVAQSARIKG
ncbi:MAG: SAM-dependent methyltransferase, partial [Flavobacteriaceae bacterium]|nr:SAM-dependent methyltransferase [Flavobacteriaceae bacterium]